MSHFDYWYALALAAFAVQTVATVAYIWHAVRWLKQHKHN